MPGDSVSIAGPDQAVVVVEADISCPVSKAWPIIRDFQGAGRFLNVPVEKVGERSGIGDLRQIRPEILEVMVGVSQYSYNCAQTRVRWPNAPITDAYRLRRLAKMKAS